ncbi:MAG: FHA domain-containing protein [Dehalococcoidia bacterium]
MTDPAELLTLRLTLLGIIFLFVLFTALVLRGTLSPRSRIALAATTSALLVVEAPARTGLSRGTAFQLIGETTIGREASNGIVLADASVSGRHAVIEANGKNWTIRDLGSTNGTRVDGEHVAGDAFALHPGAQLLVGAVRFHFQVNDAKSSPGRSR